MATTTPCWKVKARVVVPWASSIPCPVVPLPPWQWVCRNSEGWEGEQGVNLGDQEWLPPPLQAPPCTKVGGGGGA